MVYNRILLILMLLVGSSTFSVKAQNDIKATLQDGLKEVYRDTTTYVAPTVITVDKDSILEPLKVVTNKFGKNWFLFGTVGVHSFFGDYSNLGPFKGTLSPDFSIGIGKWFTPGVALKLEYMQSDSRGFTGYPNGHYGYGDPVLDSNGKFLYRKMKTRWFDVSASALLNLTRLIMGYEGMYNRIRMNQFMASFGIGMVHHLGFGGSYGSDNEWSGHVELQYSRFFTPAKRWSLDIKARGIFYQTNFDLEYGQADYAAQKIDFNWGLSVGVTFYLGKKRDNGWGRSGTKMYVRDYREREVLVVKQGESVPTEALGKVEQGTMTFYVFYPNNYSGRNDAPIVANAEVNTLDYLAGGLYTQKRYADTNAATARLQSGKSTDGLSVKDIPTEKAENLTFATNLPRGYEMSKNEPMSLSLDPQDMMEFEKNEGFVYAPIFDGVHTWQYRIDNETLGQQLLSNANYAETQTFGLNSHNGLDIVRSNMKIQSNESLVSFADFYAAVNGNEGYIAQFTDEETVSRIKDILNNGVISVVQVEGMATSQDNGNNTGSDRNNALAENRAESVLKWLQQNEKLEDALSQTFISSGNNTVNTVNDKSTRGLEAKLNRGVKVRISYLKR
ncbi:MAG: hypothetical protein J1F05_08635 [Muribaculaceae bacterium]|nr:hypothetical protein [Muribaculaceae bacterium]